MGRDDGEKEAKRRRGRSSKRSRDASPSSSDSDSSPSASSASSPSRSPEPRSRSRGKSNRKKSSSSSSRRHRHKSSGRSRSSRDDDRRRRRRRRRDEERGRRGGHAGYSSGSGSEESGRAEEAREIVREILGEFPAVAGELRQLLEMIDSGEGIDISGISDKPLVKRLKKLFRSLKLKESANGAYLLPPKSVPTLDVVGPILLASAELRDNQNENLVSQNTQELPASNFDVQNKDDITPEDPGKVDREVENAKRRIIGPAMPSRELLAAAAEMTEALRCRDAEMEADDDFLIGPPPPAMVAEAASANEAERFEEVYFSDNMFFLANLMLWTLLLGRRIRGEDFRHFRLAATARRGMRPKDSKQCSEKHSK